MERQLITSEMEMQASVIRVSKGFENGFWIKLLAIFLGFVPALTLIHDPFWSRSEVWWIGLGLIEILCFIVLFTQFYLGSTTIVDLASGDVHYQFSFLALPITNVTEPIRHLDRCSGERRTSYHRIVVKTQSGTIYTLHRANRFVIDDCWEELCEFAPKALLAESQVASGDARPAESA